MRQLVIVVTLLGLVLFSGCGFFGDDPMPKSTTVSFQVIRNEVDLLEAAIQKLETADAVKTETIDNLHAAIAKLGGEIRKDQQEPADETPDVQAKAEASEAPTSGDTSAGS